jgi:hypothetical protein
MNAPLPGSKIARLVEEISRNHAGIRTGELADLIGCKRSDLHSYLKDAIQAGLVTCCTVIKDGRKCSEYRPGPGFAHANDATLKPIKPTIIPVREHEGKIIDKPLPKPGKPPQPIYPASNAQPEVARSNTGSDPQVATSLPAEVAVSASKATPESNAKVRGLGPVAPTTPAGNDADILDKVKTMTDDEFANFFAFLMRVRAWSRVAA